MSLALVMLQQILLYSVGETPSFFVKVVYKLLCLGSPELTEKIF